jgi:hypothetical protein
MHQALPTASPRPAMVARDYFQKHKLKCVDALVVLITAWMVASVLGIQYLLSHNLPTGGDSASHLLYLWTYSRELLPNVQITAWMPEVFAGFSFLSYYFPFAFITIVGLSKLMAFAPAMKLGMFAAAIFLPAAVWLGSVYVLRLPRRVALWGVMGSLAFLLHEQNSIWGGNLLSTLAGEFTQSYGVLFSVLTLFAWQRCIATGRGWHWVALLEAATGFSNGFSLLITGFATTAFLFDASNFWRNLKLMLCGHALAFFMLAGWLWPMLQMHSLTIPNDALFEVQSWHDLLPFPVAVMLALGVLGGLLHTVLNVTPQGRQKFPADEVVAMSWRYSAFMVFCALLSAAGFLAGSDIGLANIRFFPFVWLFGGLACGWMWGSLVWRVQKELPTMLWLGTQGLVASLVLFFGFALTLNMRSATDWGLWNHSGLETKPQWQQLTQLFPTLQGKLDSPRLLFEHDPANNDIGSTRTLEALPMFLGGRPVLEGLYMESASVSPAIYQLQSEVSTHPSSPLARFPSSSLDLERAAKHMRFLWSDQVLIRNEATLKAFVSSQDFSLQASAAPFSVFKLKQFDTHLVDVLQVPLQWHSKKNWMETSFQWFNSRQNFEKYVPVFHDGEKSENIKPAALEVRINTLTMDRTHVAWTTNAVNSAHLVRMTWHPKWRLVTKGKLYLAGPGFMLVVPEEENVRLEYTDTSVGLWGMVATVLAFVVFVFMLTKRPAVETEHAQAWRSLALGSPAWPMRLNVRNLVWVWPLILIAIGGWFHLKNPERVYTQAWVDMRAGNFAGAAPQFDSAFEGRKSNAKKEEALFWAAKAYQQLQQDDKALQRFEKLTTEYHGYWLPEALFTHAELAAKKGQLQEAQELRRRLIEDYPQDRWTQKLESKK